MIVDVDQGLTKTFADKPTRGLSSNVASMVHELPETGTSEMSDAENVHNGGMSRRVSEVNDLLQAMEIVPETAKTSFAEKLAQENAWPIERAEAALREYRRFLLMAWVSPGMVVPSKDVDEAWHLHLTHSRHYWEVLCGTILQKPFHHEPSLGGEAEDARHGDAYGRTLSLYEHLFDEEAPRDVWPRGCGCAERTTDRSVVLASAPFIPIAIFGLFAAVIAWAGGHDTIALIIAIGTIAIAGLVTAADASEKRDYEERAERTRRENARRSEQRTHYGIEPGTADLADRLARARKETAAASATSRVKPAPYRAPRSSRGGSSRSSSMDRSGDDASSTFAAILASDDGSSSHSSHSSHSHSSHSCSSHSSHSCGSSSHSCGSSSSSCGSSCGGGGGCGGGGD